MYCDVAFLLMSKKLAINLTGHPVFRSSTASHRDGPDSEGEDVCDGGDCDGDAGVLHGERDPVLEGAAERLLLGQVVEALDHHEHVVDADSWEEGFTYRVAHLVG